MTTQLKLGEIEVDVVRKAIKNVHLSVYPPTGRVRLAAPSEMRLETIRVFAVSKLDWIKRQQRKLREQERETPRDYVDRESHYVWGQRFLLKVREADERPSIHRTHRTLTLTVRPGTSKSKKQELVSDWYRQLLREAAMPLVQKWSEELGVDVSHLFVQSMKTKWGSANHVARTVRLNTELAKKPKQCLEYLVVHELVHLLEPTHNTRFQSLMDHFMPQWRLSRRELNKLPVRHESWGY